MKFWIPFLSRKKQIEVNKATNEQIELFWKLPNYKKRQLVNYIKKRQDEKSLRKNH